MVSIVKEHLQEIKRALNNSHTGMMSDLELNSGIIDRRAVMIDRVINTGVNTKVNTSPNPNPILAREVLTEPVTSKEKHNMRVLQREETLVLCRPRLSMVNMRMKREQKI